MNLSKITHIICFDDHRNFTEDVKKRFSDATRYFVTSFHNKQAFLDQCKANAVGKSCTVSIIGFSESPDKIELLNDFIATIKTVLPNTAIIVLVQPSKLEAVKTGITHVVDGVIPINNNTVLRIHNTVKRIISEFNINIFRKRRNRAVAITSVFALAVVLLFIYLRISYPQLF